MRSRGYSTECVSGMFDFSLSEHIKLEGLVDTHIHTAPDVRDRFMNDIELASAALREGMEAVVIKSHTEPTSGRAALASEVTGMRVIGGVTLNTSVGGLNPDAVHAAAMMGGRFVWLPTVSVGRAAGDLDGVISAVAEHDMVLGTGHLKPPEIFHVLDLAADYGAGKIIINHPLTGVVGATLEEQREMSRRAYLEHCLVACMPRHDGLDFERIVESVRYVGAERCIMATDFGQGHNPSPIAGMKQFIYLMKKHGFSHSDITMMCRDNPLELIS
ncbi:DUF6282 family protein [Methanothermobacter sp.]|uniref:DUF6282 family protein n=1 Tax=Methanothermobacter sp. TaxID=1884223 RepID=UPI00260B758F|nr:DUF6282 family protein [Methanothermobacter sp.]MDI9618702.1 DUF6282 family protein [Methanothermobacter sp.]